MEDNKRFDTLGRLEDLRCAPARLCACPHVHPINNRRILEYLRKQFGADPDAINTWCATWISAGFSFGNTPTIADVYLIPQIESARRFKVDLQRWPSILEVDAKCGALDAFQRATPMAQSDAS